ncbi:helix-turn-helix transcriptional regulator [Microbacterium sp. Root553]|uniref:helix-turn-helix transcriptional regulator n=1 Tax=Microbacterium sp. Root553 TaxID=1736556 RepID=UPI0009EC2F96|nr:helix-turn-helix transcriptional regulator [Microbacterium sp. Root553]
MPHADDDPNFDALRLHLARLRHERGWSYDELAARSGVGRSTLVTLESGSPRRNPEKPATTGTLTTWYRIAQAFDTDLGDLLAPLHHPARNDSDGS